MPHEEPTVYVVQEVLRRNLEGELEPAKDLSPAREFGKLLTLYRAPRRVGATGLTEEHRKRYYHDMVESLWEAGLKGYTVDDYLLPCGDPAAIAAAAGLAAYASGGRIKVLCWDSRTRAYGVAELSLWDEEDNEQEG